MSDLDKREYAKFLERVEKSRSKEMSKKETEKLNTIKCPACEMSNTANDLVFCMYCGYKFGDPLPVVEELTQEEKEEISANAEPCDPETCPDCDESECANYQGDDEDICEEVAPESTALAVVENDTKEDPCDGCTREHCGGCETGKKLQKEADNEHDDEFMSDVSEKPAPRLTPAQQKAKMEHLKQRNAEIIPMIEKGEKIAELSGHYGFQLLIADLKESTCDEIQENELKEATKGIKALEAVLNTKAIIEAKRTSFSELKREFKNNLEEIEKLDCIQNGLFDDIKEGEIIEAEFVKETSDDQDLINEIPKEKEAIKEDKALQTVVEEYTAKIRGMIDTEEYEFAYETLEGILDWVEEHQHITDDQISAVDNIEESVEAAA